MDLDLIEDLLVADASEHPSIKTVDLETDGGTVSVINAIKRDMPRDWQQGAGAIVDGTYTTIVLLRRHCQLVPHVGAVIVHGTDRWSVRQVTHAYGGLAYRCVCLLQQ